MASKDLIVDDDYINSMGNYFLQQGEHIDSMINSYVSIMRTTKNKAISSGEVSKALGTYITYASKMNKQVGKISKNTKKLTKNFLSRIDAEDKYLF